MHSMPDTAVFTGLLALSDDNCPLAFLPDLPDTIPAGIIRAVFEAAASNLDTVRAAGRDVTEAQEFLDILCVTLAEQIAGDAQ